MHKPRIKLSFWQIRLLYALISASCMCVIMSAFTTSILAPHTFWEKWPHVLSLDLLIAIPATLVLGPAIRKFIHWLTGELV